MGLDNGPESTKLIQKVFPHLPLEGESHPLKKNRIHFLECRILLSISCPRHMVISLD
jgi:hypothetical protein